MTRETLILLQALLHDQTIKVGADDEHIAAVFKAKKELKEELAKDPR